MLCGDYEPDLKGVYAKLVTYSEQHFRHEEEFLVEKGYAEIEEQRQSHQEFVANLSGIKDKVEEHQEGDVRGIYRFLREWWLGHIVGVDRKYGQLLGDEAR